MPTNLYIWTPQEAFPPGPSRPLFLGARYDLDMKPSWTREQTIHIYLRQWGIIVCHAMTRTEYLPRLPGNTDRNGTKKREDIQPASQAPIPSFGPALLTKIVSWWNDPFSVTGRQARAGRRGRALKTSGAHRTRHA